MKTVIRIATFIFALFPVIVTLMEESQITTVFSMITISFITVLMVETIVQSFSIPHSWSKEKNTGSPNHANDCENESDSLQKVA